MTSKNETTNSPIHEFKELHKGQRAFENHFLMAYHFLFIKYFKKHFKTCFFISKPLKYILQHFEFVSWWIRGFVLWEKIFKWLRKVFSHSRLKIKNLQFFLTTWTIYLNCEKSEQCLVCVFLDFIQRNKKYSLNCSIFRLNSRL